MPVGDSTGYPFPPQNPAPQPCAVPEQPAEPLDDETEEESAE